MAKRKETAALDLEASPHSEYPYRPARVGEIVEFMFEGDDGKLATNRAQVQTVPARHIVGLLSSNEHQEPVEHYYSNADRPGCWRFLEA